MSIKAYNRFMNTASVLMVVGSVAAIAIILLS